MDNPFYIWQDELFLIPYRAPPSFFGRLMLPEFDLNFNSFMSRTATAFWMLDENGSSTVNGSWWLRQVLPGVLDPVTINVADLMPKRVYKALQQRNILRDSDMPELMDNNNTFDYNLEGSPVSNLLQFQSETMKAEYKIYNELLKSPGYSHWNQDEIFNAINNWDLTQQYSVKLNALISYLQLLELIPFRYDYSDYVSKFLYVPHIPRYRDHWDGSKYLDADPPPSPEL